MTAADRESLLRTLYNGLPDSAAIDMDLDALYVRRSDDEQHDAIANLRQRLLLSERPNQTFLFSGLRGAGKTTELLKLISILRQDEVAAYYCDASQHLNLNDPSLELQELLLVVLAGFARAAEPELGTQIGQLWSEMWTNLKRTVKLSVEFSLPFGAGSIRTSLSDQPKFRAEFKRISQESNAFFDEARRFGDTLAEKLKANRRARKVLLVVDSLERRSAPPGSEQQLFVSLKNLYFNDPARLQFGKFAVIYSAPPYLQAVLPNVSSGFSYAVTLPNFKVMERPKTNNDLVRNQSGIARLVDVLSRRLPMWREIVDQTVVEELAWMSGGNVRQFFRMLTSLAVKLGLTKSPLPIQQASHPAVQQILAETAQPLQWLNQSDREWLARFMDPTSPPASHIQNLEDDLPPIIRLFDHSLVLDYQNGDIWYQVPPLVRDRVQLG